MLTPSLLAIVDWLLAVLATPVSQPTIMTAGMYNTRAVLSAQTSLKREQITAMEVALVTHWG